MFFGGPRFRELTAEFIQHHNLRWEDRRTTASNIRILERSIGDLRLKDITLLRIEAFQAARLEDGISKSTVNRQIATLSAFFSWAIKRGHHPGPNPARDVETFKESPGRMRFLTETEADRLILAASEHLKPILVAALHTGGRLSELLSLRWSDVNWDVPPYGMLTFRKETTKTRKARSLPLSPELARCLRGIRKRPADDRIFGFRGEAVTSIRTAFESARRKAGLDDLHFHDLRHTFASWYVQNTGDIYRLQKYLGHGTMKMTQRYAHLSQSFLQDGVEFIGPPRHRSTQSQSDDRNS